VNDDDLLGSGAFVSLLDPELNRITPPQPIGVHSVSEVVHMYENVRLPVVAPNETVPLLVIEPLDIPCYSIRHFTSSPLST
jgi:hypothetical protein